MSKIKRTQIKVIIRVIKTESSMAWNEYYIEAKYTNPFARFGRSDVSYGYKTRQELIKEIQENTPQKFKEQIMKDILSDIKSKLSSLNKKDDDIDVIEKFNYDLNNLSFNFEIDSDGEIKL